MIKNSLIDKALLILVQSQFIAKRALHGIRYQEHPRRRPVAGEPVLAHPRRHGYRQSGTHPFRKFCRFDPCAREMLANTSTPPQLQMCRVVNLGLDIDTAMVPQLATSYSVGYQNGWLKVAQSLTQQKRCRMRMSQLAIANAIAIYPFQLLSGMDALASHVGRPAILPEPRLDNLLGGVNTRTPLLQHFVKQIRRPRLAQRRPSKLRAMEPLQVRRKERHGRAILAET